MQPKLKLGITIAGISQAPGPYFHLAEELVLSVKELAEPTAGPAPESGGLGALGIEKLIIFASETDRSFLVQTSLLRPHSVHTVPSENHAIEWVWVDDPNQLLETMPGLIDFLIAPLGRLVPLVCPVPNLVILLAQPGLPGAADFRPQQDTVGWNAFRETALRAKSILTHNENLKQLLIQTFNKEAHSVNVVERKKITDAGEVLGVSCHQMRRIAEGLRKGTVSTPESVRFSIVTPSFNQNRYLKQTIESILSQTYRNFEYLIIDGGSTDGSIDTLKSYGTKLNWTSEPDRGYADALNKGFARSTGDYFLWLASDDFFADSFALEKLAHAIEISKADVVYGDVYYVNELGVRKGFYRTMEFSSEGLKDWCFIAQPGACFRAEVFNRLGGLNPNLKSIADYDLWLRMDKINSKFFQIGTPLACYRLHAASITVSQSLKTYLEILDLQLGEFGKVYPSWLRGSLQELINVLTKVRSLQTPSLRSSCVKFFFRAVRKLMPIWFIEPLLIHFPFIQRYYAAFLVRVLRSYR